MSENEGFFRKVVRFVSNPATDWTDLSSHREDNRDLEIEKSELKAMIERKRRNDFVRKREFEMLRKVRREGLTSEQLSALGGSARLDDSEARAPDSKAARPDSGVKAKIDEIEQQMVGDGFVQSTRRPGRNTSDAPSEPAAMPARSGPSSRQDGRLLNDAERRAALPALPDADLAPAAAPAPVQMAGGLAPMAPMALGPAAGGSDFRGSFAVEVSEAQHDPELDEAVIAFANADFSQCEHALQQITGPGGARSQHAETWLVLFDLYRAIGQQPRFESLAIDYAQQFGWSAPQWYSLPKLVADAVAEERLNPGARVAGEIGWICPPQLDIDAVARLRSLTLQMPLPWVFDWSALRRIDAEAAMQLSTLFRLWAGQRLEMRWLSGEKLFAVLQEAAPTGVRDADPAFWLTRLDGLRLTNRADQFDEAAIDYCVTYELSPPSWEPARCKVHVSGSSHSTQPAPLSMVSDVSTSFHESGLADKMAAGVSVAHVELSGQLVGDISATLTGINVKLGDSPVVSVSCARLIRVDFIAAGDLLNWVLARRNEKRTVRFEDAHRLVALFFGAMGINEHSKVQVRRV
jgi:hypothetical protein